MKDKADVFDDHTVGQSDSRQQRAEKNGGTGSQQYQPGEQVFKTKPKTRSSHRHGYSNIPGAGANPAKAGANVDNA